MARNLIYKIDCRKERFIPEFERHRYMSKKRKTSFNNVTIFSFGKTIKLIRMGTQDKVHYTNFVKESMQLLIFVFSCF